MVQQKLKELNGYKSQGPDEIHLKLLKELSSVIAEPLAKLFQNSLVQGVVSNDWRKGTNNKLYSYNMNNATLKTVDVERDLGVIINNNGKYSEQCLMAAKKANCVLGMIKRNIKCKNAAIIMRLYKSLERPRLEYCIQAWSPYHKKDIEVLERVQKWATKWFMDMGI